MEPVVQSWISVDPELIENKICIRNKTSILLQTRYLEKYSP
jgi:hypothetical protein